MKSKRERERKPPWLLFQYIFKRIGREDPSLQWSPTTGWGVGFWNEFLLLLNIEFHTSIMSVIKKQYSSKCTILWKWNSNQDQVFLLLLKIYFLQYFSLSFRCCKCNNNQGGFSSSSFENRVPYHHYVFDKMAIKF